METARLEFAVMQQGAAKVAHADERGMPLPVNAERSLDGGNEAGDVVTHPTDAEFAEIGEVLAYLRGVDVAGFGQRAGGDDLYTVALHAFEHLHVDRQPTDGGSGDTFAFE